MEKTNEPIICPECGTTVSDSEDSSRCPKCDFPVAFEMDYTRVRGVERRRQEAEAAKKAEKERQEKSKAKGKRDHGWKYWK